MKCIRFQDSLAEWSKALAQGASPQGRGFEPHSCHFQNMVLSVGVFSCKGREPNACSFLPLIVFWNENACKHRFDVGGCVRLFFDSCPIRFTTCTRPKNCTDQRCQISQIANFIVVWVAICLKSFRLYVSSQLPNNSSRIGQQLPAKRFAHQ